LRKKDAPEPFLLGAVRLGLADFIRMVVPLLGL
jgi:hypothetical protein